MDEYGLLVLRFVTAICVTFNLFAASDAKSTGEGWLQHLRFVCPARKINCLRRTWRALLQMASRSWGSWARVCFYNCRHCCCTSRTSRKDQLRLLSPTKVNRIFFTSACGGWSCIYEYTTPNTRGKPFFLLWVFQSLVLNQGFFNKVPISCDS